MEVEVGIPIPPKGKAQSEFCRKIRALKVNESVLLDSLKQRDHARHIIKGLGGSYASRKVEGGWRLWRTA